MSLEQLIEQDMVRFLDGEVKEPHVETKPRYEDTALLFLNKDWVLEINRLLKRNDVEAAKRYFDELKQHYAAIPDSHPEEKKRTYAVLQDSYLLIVNFMQERLRTNVLLKHMEQSPDDVFDVAVKPVDLQRVQQQAPTSIPDLPQLTKEMLTTEHRHPLAEQHNITLPAPPSSMGGLGGSGGVSASTGGVPATAAPSGGTGGGGTGGESAAAPVKKDTSTEFVLAARQTLQYTLATAKTDPQRAGEMLEKLRTTLQASDVPQETKQLLHERIATLEAAVASFQARKTFAASFNKSLAAVAQLGRVQEGRSIEQFAALTKEAEAFEAAHPVYAGVFTQQLGKLKEQYALYNEDELVERMMPLLQTIKETAKARNIPALTRAIDELERFAHHLPRTAHRDLLERTAQALRRKLTTTQPLTGEALLQKVHPFIERIKAASQSKDGAAYRNAVKDLAGFILTMPPGGERTMLEHKLSQLQVKRVMANG